jgi:hypothetical protein
VLEWLPKSDKYKEWPERKSVLGHYLPQGEPRVIPPGALIHQSVMDRMKAVPNYRPVNMPDAYEVVDMPDAPAGSRA